jgi:prepilin-type processing-associated H-X9-DG protein
MREKQNDACDARFAEAQYPVPKTSPHGGMSSSSRPISSHRTPGSAGSKPRVLFDQFNLEASSDEVCHDQAVGLYDAQKKPLKARTSSVALCTGIYVVLQGILRKHVGVAGKGSVTEGASASGTDSDALWTVGSRCVQSRTLRARWHADGGNIVFADGCAAATTTAVAAADMTCRGIGRTVKAMEGKHCFHSQPPLSSLFSQLAQFWRRLHHWHLRRFSFRVTPLWQA